ncbi:MAG: SWIM zinc finger family protein [Candidatus Dormiibacterota bacterium]
MSVNGRPRGRRRRGQPLGESWWSQRFLAVLEAFDSGFRVDRGREYARRGRVRSLLVGPGELRASVQGSRRVPYSVRVTYPMLSLDDWRRVERAMAGQALFAARMLAGELPHEAEDLFSRCGLQLFPQQGADLRSSCTCPDETPACKHVAALFYAFAQALDRDPFLLFRWRGLDREQLIADLRALRSGDESALAGPTNEASGGTPPAPEQRAEFWASGVDVAEIPIHPQAAGVPDGVLRELGPTGVRLGEDDLVGRLRPLYAAIVHDALRRSLGDAGEAAAAEESPADGEAGRSEG